MQRDDIPTYSSSIMHANANPSLSHHDQEHVIRCPRCNSSNTKFCYYNNYNLSQPRHFCKSCRRYWTKGGTLRDIPVGGGTRKTSKRALNTSKRASSSSNLTVNSPPPKPKLEGFGIPVITTSTGTPYTSLMGPTPGMGQFAKLLMHGLSHENIVNASKDEEGLIRNPIVEDFVSGFFDMSRKSTNDQSETRVEGDYMLPDLSIYTPGSNFR